MSSQLYSIAYALDSLLECFEFRSLGIDRFELLDHRDCDQFDECVDCLVRYECFTYQRRPVC